MSAPAPNYSEFRAGGKPLFASMVGIAFGASPIVYNVMPLVIGPIHREFGWDFTLISGGLAAYGLLGASLAPVFGYLADRYGARPVTLLSMIAFSGVFAGFAFLPNSKSIFFSLCLLMGLITIGTSPVTFTRVVSAWFYQKRGLALGMMLLGTSLTGLIIPHVTLFAMDTGSWRTAFISAASLPIFLALPLGLRWLKEPCADDFPPHTTQAALLSGATLRLAVRNRRFWLLFISIFCIALAYGGAFIHLGEMISLQGFSVKVAATAITCMAGGIFSGRLVVGFLFDYYWAPLVVFPSLVLGGLGCFLLMGSGFGLYGVLLAGFLLGLSSGAETDAIAYMTSRYFGMKHYGRIFGMLYVPYAIGASVSPLLYGTIRDQTGNYDLMLMIAAALYTGGALLLLFLGRYPVTFQVPMSEKAQA